jgi:poly-gamma-glutamate capsule biosynthesis protein CapA/YwtB (metallophosphatase superfamily)
MLIKRVILYLFFFLFLYLPSCSVFQSGPKPKQVPIDQILITKKDTVAVIKPPDIKPEIKKTMTPVIDSVSFLFIGDIMGHGPQIKAAYNDSTETYNYDEVFEHVAPIHKKHDFTIANLEVTLAGPPYKGYPKFSSPDALVDATKKSGINVLMFSNNHTYDRGEKGVIRTLEILDKKGIPTTGAFVDSLDRDSSNVLILEKGELRIGILNYTFWTNVQIDSPTTIVNVIDTTLMKSDIEKAKQDDLDELIVMLHWGPEYKVQPSRRQRRVANFLFRQGINIIIGAHPHVLQPMQFFSQDSLPNDRLIAYSLGNYVSNQRTLKRDGGAMLSFEIKKVDDKITIQNVGYYLTWVHKFKRVDVWRYEIIPVYIYEKSKFPGLDKKAVEKVKLFINDSRSFLRSNNTSVEEIKN